MTPFYARGGGYGLGDTPTYNNMELTCQKGPLNKYWFELVRRQARNVYLNMEHGTDLQRRAWRGTRGGCGRSSGRSRCTGCRCRVYRRLAATGHVPLTALIGAVDLTVPIGSTRHAARRHCGSIALRLTPGDTPCTWAARRFTFPETYKRLPADPHARAGVRPSRRPLDAESHPRTAASCSPTRPCCRRRRWTRCGELIDAFDESPWRPERDRASTTATTSLRLAAMPFYAVPAGGRRGRSRPADDRRRAGVVSGSDRAEVEERIRRLLDADPGRVRRLAADLSSSSGNCGQHPQFTHTARAAAGLPLHAAPAPPAAIAPPRTSLWSRAVRLLGKALTAGRVLRRSGVPSAFVRRAGRRHAPRPLAGLRRRWCGCCSAAACARVPADADAPLPAVAAPALAAAARATATGWCS